VIVHELNMQELEHPSRYLTDNYKRDEGSNNYKILDLGHREHVEIMRNIRLIEAWRDMDNAEGFTLDKIGKNVLELRNGRDDVAYRKAIKIKIRGNISAGLVEDLNVVADILFGDSFISVSDTWHQELYDFEPAGVTLHLHELGGLDFERGAVFWRDIAFLNDIMAGGVGLRTRHTTEHNVGVYHAAGLSALLSEYIICDETPIAADIYSYHAAGLSAVSREFIITDTEPITGDVTDYSAVGLIEFGREVHHE